MTVRCSFPVVVHLVLSPVAPRMKRRNPRSGLKRDPSSRCSSGQISSSEIWLTITGPPSPWFSVSVASKGLRFCASGLESTLAGISISVDSKSLSAGWFCHRRREKELVGKSSRRACSKFSVPLVRKGWITCGTSRHSALLPRTTLARSVRLVKKYFHEVPDVLGIVDTSNGT